VPGEATLGVKFTDGIEVMRFAVARANQKRDPGSAIAEHPPLMHIRGML
jgi:hypothetical protein